MSIQGGLIESGISPDSNLIELTDILIPIPLVGKSDRIEMETKIIAHLGALTLEIACKTLKNNFQNQESKPFPMQVFLSDTSLLIVQCFAAFSISAAIVASIHVILRSGDNRSAIGWLGLFWLGYPLIGSLIYLMVGVNLIRRDKKAIGAAILSKTKRRRPHAPRTGTEPLRSLAIAPHMHTLKKMGDRILGNKLHAGDLIEPLIGGSQAYPAMIAAINSAQRSIALASYIFKDDYAGNQFADALQNAQNRGVQVRVLIDAMGSTHGGRSIYRNLKNRGLPVHRFMPTLGLPFFRFINLRNHRKILVVDGHTAFTGGTNIDVAFWPEHCPPDVETKSDFHFRVQGPVISDIMAAFEQDWRFTTGEALDGDTWKVALIQQGPMFARGIPDGPDSNTRLTHSFILAALATAKHSIRIVTPYFLPPSDIISAIGVAILRGVKIEILVPDPTNSLLVQWASGDYLKKIDELGGIVWADKGHFSHTKLMVVDGCWSMIGSANWDPRSLRLNFEFNLECHSEELASKINHYWDERMKSTQIWHHPTIGERPRWMEIRDGLARLCTPLL